MWSKKICFSFHTILYSFTTFCVSMAYLRNGNESLSLVVSLLGVFSQSGVSVFLSLLVFVTFFGRGVGAAIHEKKKWLMFYWVCLPFRFVWLHLMFPVASLFVLIHRPPPNSITSDLAASQPLLIFKGVGAWSSDSEHRPDFHSLIFPSHFPLSP